MKTTIIVLAVLLLACPAVRAQFPDEGQVVIVPEEDVQELSGRIIQIDEPASYILVRSYVDEAQDSYRDDSIYVLKEAVIEKDGKTIQFGDLAQDDPVTVRYRITMNGRKEADHIWVGKR